MDYFCGPKWFPKFLKKMISGKSNGACKCHDMMYANPQNNIENERFYVDKALLVSMVADSSNDLQMSKAFFFYIMVRSLGWSRWGKK
jgi:hypothetical protein